MNTVRISDSFQLMGAGAAFREEMCEMIADTQLFADFDWKDIEALATYMQCYQVSAGTTVFREGDPGHYLCLLVRGQVEIRKNDHEGTPHRMVLVSRGKTIGEMSIVDGEPRSATCVTQQDSVLLLLTKDNYARIIHERPGLAVHILSKLARLMSQRLRCASGQLVEYLEHEETPCPGRAGTAG